MERETLIALVQGVQNGNEDALAEIYNTFHNDLYYYIYKTINDPELAADLTQDTFIEILQSIHTLQEPAAFVTWSRQIAYRRCTAYFKKRHDFLVDEDEDGYSVFDTIEEDRIEFIPDAALDKEDLRQTLHNIINELPAEQRSAIMMRYFDELPVTEVARIQGVSEGTVKSRLNYGRKALKQAVEEYEKKNGIKLHCVGVVPLLLWLLRQSRIAKGLSTTTGAAKSVGLAGVKTASAGSAAKIAAGTTAAKAAAGTATAKAAAGAVTTKIVAAIVSSAVALTLVGGGVALVAAKKDSDKDSEQSKPKTSSTTPVVDSSKPGKEKYESNKLKPYSRTPEVKDIFVGFGNPKTTFYTKDGQLLFLDTLEPVFEDAQNVNALDDCGYYTYTDSDGNQRLANINDSMLCTDVRGEIFWVYKSAWYNRICIFSVDADGNLYFNSFQSDDVKYADNERLTFYDSSTQQYYSNVDSIRAVNKDGNTYLYIEREGTAYAFRVCGTFGSSMDMYDISIGKIGDIVDFGYSGAISALYRKDGDNNTLYYRYNVWDPVELPLHLPAGKTVDQLTHTVFYSTTCLFFDDGSVYTAKLTNDAAGPTFVLDKTLTSLHQAGAIWDVQIYEEYHSSLEPEITLYLLLDDNVTYTYMP